MDKNPSAKIYTDTNSLKDTLEKTLIAAKKNKKTGGFIDICIDNIAMLLSSQGHEFVDNILSGLTQEIANNLTKDDAIFSMDRNHIGIVITNASKLDKQANNILTLIQEYGCKVSAVPTHLTATLGGVDFPGTADNVIDILDFAYIALFDAKEAHMQYVHYSNRPKHQHESSNQLILANYFQDAMQQNKLRLAFQPIINAKTGEISHHESLLRLVDEDGKTTSAGPFIPIAEKLGFIEAIDILVLKMVADELNKHINTKLAFNVSNNTIQSKTWLPLAKKLLSSPSIAARTVVEITETAEQPDEKKTIEFITELREIGCKVALDDFGSGYTNFAQIKSLPVDIIKIDGFFIRDIMDNHDNQKFVKTLVEFTQNYGLKTVAEFVESKEIADLLIDIGVDFLQGNYFSPAVDYRSWAGE